MYAHDFTDFRTYTYSREIHREGDVAEQFIVKNDSLAFKSFINAYGICHYESEYFLYSLMMALDFNNNRALFEIDRLIDEFYNKYKVDKGTFANNFSSYIHSSHECLENDSINIKSKELKLFIKKSFMNKKRNVIKSSFVLKIVENGDSLNYFSLEDTLHHKCLKMENLSPDDYYIYNFGTSKYLFYSFYHIDKNSSSEGYYFLYKTIYNFYIEKGIVPSIKSAKLMMYLLKKATKMKLPAAIKEYHYLTIEEDEC